MELCDKLHAPASREANKFVVENEASAAAAAELKAEVARLAGREDPQQHCLSMFDVYETPGEGAAIMYWCVWLIGQELGIRLPKHKHLTQVSK